MNKKTFLLVLLLLVATLLPAFALATANPAGHTLSGQVMISDKSPMANAVVLVYSSFSGPPPNPYKYWRIPDMVFTADAKGSFSLNLPDGTYYLMVAQKKMDGEIGPPLDSEQLYFHADAKGEALPITIANNVAVNLGKLQGTFFWTPEMSERVKNITAIEGVVVDMDDKPVGGVVVLAFYTHEARRRPAFISDRTDKQGRFSLRVAEGGNYWLRVRGVIGGGAPEPGERLNTTDDFDPLMVSLATGERVGGVQLRVKVFDGKGATGAPKLEKKWKLLNEPQPIPGTTFKPVKKQ